MLLNAFDVDTDGSERSVELRLGELPQLELQIDLLVLTTPDIDHPPPPGSPLDRLQQTYDLTLQPEAAGLDLRDSPLRSWVSQPLSLGDRAPGCSRFQRLAVLEEGAPWQPDDLLPWPLFNRLFSLLALLPMRRIACHSVACPLLGSEQQGLEPLIAHPDLLQSYREAFRYVPQLQRLILFDSSEAPLQRLGEAIDAALERSTLQSQRLVLPVDHPGLDQLTPLLREWSRVGPGPSHSLAHDVAELLLLLRSEAIAPISLGIHARRVAEQLVQHRLAEATGTPARNLNDGIRQLQRNGTDPWLISCLHQVRCFGNWMGHPPRGGHDHPVQLHDVLAMLSALQKVLVAYPW